MNKKHKTNKFISGMLIAPMVLSVSGTCFENFKIFASSDFSIGASVPSFGESLLESDSNYEVELDENNIDENKLKYELNIKECKAYLKECVNKDVEEIKIPVNVIKDNKSYKVISIKGNAFRECNRLKKVEISDGVEYIGAEAFYYCYSLISVHLPSSLKWIGMRAFERCGSLTSVGILEGVEYIGANAFNDSYSLKEITL